MRVDDLFYVEDDLREARARFASHERAPSEGRVADWVVWMEARDYLRGRVAELERRREELLAGEDRAA